MTQNNYTYPEKQEEYHGNIADALNHYLSANVDEQTEEQYFGVMHALDNLSAMCDNDQNDPCYRHLWNTLVTFAQHYNDNNP